MALPSISTPKVKIVNKDLEAWIRLPALEEGEHYTIVSARCITGEPDYLWN